MIAIENEHIAFAARNNTPFYNGKSIFVVLFRSI